MILVILLLIVALIFALCKWVAYYNATKGLLYYLITRHDEKLDTEKVKELGKIAASKSIEDFFKLK